jgi:hypothetical protein
MTTWSELLCICPKDYESRADHSTILIRGQDLIGLAAHVELSPEALIEERVDFKALAAHSTGAVGYLPEKYSTAPRSKVRTSAHLLDCIEARLGWKVRSRLLRKFQVTESLIGDADARINIRFLTDLCAELSRLGISELDLREMGAHSLFRNYHTPLGQAFRALKGPQSLLERCFTEIIQESYDQNHLYTLQKLDQTECVVRVSCNPEVSDALRAVKLGSSHVCQAREGTFSSLSGYQNLPFAEVSERKCIHRGDSTCEYVIRFESAARTFCEGSH